MTQLNTRIDAEVKRRGDAVFEREGLSSSQVVRAVWQYAADTQQLPDCLRVADDHERERRIEAVRRGAGLVSRMLEEELGMVFSSQTETFDYEAFRDELYDGMIDEMAARHV